MKPDPAFDFGLVLSGPLSRENMVAALKCLAVPMLEEWPTDSARATMRWRNRKDRSVPAMAPLDWVQMADNLPSDATTIEIDLTAPNLDGAIRRGRAEGFFPNGG